MAITANWRSKSLCFGATSRAKAFGDSEDEDEPYNDEDALDFIDKYCLNCPVMVQCKAWVDANPQTHGVYGATLASERNPVDTDSNPE